MRAVIQRVKEASVQVENQEVGSIDHGILVLL
ncbi:MAG: D-aminoacyl-tRNA deacylase, partial [Syntrophobacterales bacterium]